MLLFEGRQNKIIGLAWHMHTNQLPGLLCRCLDLREWILQFYIQFVLYVISELYLTCFSLMLYIKNFIHICICVLFIQSQLIMFVSKIKTQFREVCISSAKCKSVVSAFCP